MKTNIKMTIVFSPRLILTFLKAPLCLIFGVIISGCSPIQDTQEFFQHFWSTLTKKPTVIKKDHNKPHAKNQKNGQVKKTSNPKINHSNEPEKKQKKQRSFKVLNRSVPEISFMISTGTGYESDGEANVVIYLSEPYYQNIHFNLKISGGEAIFGEDFHLKTLDHKIPAGEHEISIPIQLIRDNQDEKIENFYLKIVDAQNATIGNRNIYDYSILD